MFPKLIYKFRAIPINIPANFSAEMDTLILKFIWRCKACKIVKTILRKKNKIRRLTFPNLKTCYEHIVVRTMWHCYKHRQIGKRNRIEDPEINPYIYDQLFLIRVPRVGSHTHLYHTIQKNLLKMDQRSKCKNLNYKTLEEMI